MYKCSRDKGFFNLWLHESVCSSFERDAGWDFTWMPRDRVVLIQPSTSKQGVRKMVQKFDKHSEMYGYGHVLMFKRMDACDLPVFGMLSIEPILHDDDLLEVKIPPTHLLPWQKPFRPSTWSVEEASMILETRVRSAMSTGLDLREAIAICKVPAIVKDFLAGDAWKLFLEKLQQA